MKLNYCNRTKILLISPPSDLDAGTKSLIYVYDRFQPLGLAYIASVLEKAGYEVKIIDAKVEFLSINKILNRIKEFNPQLIGISSSTPDFCMSRSLANQIKSIGDYTILIGGPHVSALPEETIKEDCFDYGIIGEGEITTVQLVKALTENNTQDIPNIKGIIFKNNSHIIRTPIQPYVEDLDTIPFPARHLLPDISKYRCCYYKRLPVGPIITSRGCPYQCIFCDRAVFGNRLRMRSINNILDEIELLVRKYKVRGIDIVDDLFTVTPQRVMEFCSRLIQKRLNIPWFCMARADCVSPETLKAMKKAGCWLIGYGIESGNQDILDKAKKNITLEVIERTVKSTKEAGIVTLGFFILGLPWETKISLRDTLLFAKKIPLDRAIFFITQPFPGSELYKIALPKGEIVKDAKYSFYHKYLLPKKIPYVASGLSEGILRKYHKHCYRSFYLRPSHIFKQIFKYHEIRDLMNRAINFLRAIL